jgi:hypothetical protein
MCAQPPFWFTESTFHPWFNPASPSSQQHDTGLVSILYKPLFRNSVDMGKDLKSRKMAMSDGDPS